MRGNLKLVSNNKDDWVNFISLLSVNFHDTEFLSSIHPVVFKTDKVIITGDYHNRLKFKLYKSKIQKTLRTCHYSEEVIWRL